jgi:hypothetical protein
MNPFTFHVELFDCRNAVFEALSDNGFVWLQDFGSIDLRHDMYGLEVTAIREEKVAIVIEGLLRKLFPDWHYVNTFYDDFNLEHGWTVAISRDPEDFDDSWRRTRR